VAVKLRWKQDLQTSRKHLGLGSFLRRMWPRNAQKILGSGYKAWQQVLPIPDSLLQTAESSRCPDVAAATTTSESSRRPDVMPLFHLSEAMEHLQTVRQRKDTETQPNMHPTGAQTDRSLASFRNENSPCLSFALVALPPQVSNNAEALGSSVACSLNPVEIWNCYDVVSAT
jgi:hypothetical protein